MTDEQIVLSVEDRDKLFEERFESFIREIGQLAGQMPVAAIGMICWQKDELVSIGVTLPRAPSRIQMRIVDLMARKFAQAVGMIKSKINLQ